jgi:3-oxoadipate enol-lactonase
MFRRVTGHGPGVVLTHDGLADSAGWADVVPGLATGDRRGYGRSPAADTDHSSADDLADLVRELADGPAVLVGSSFGSLVTLVCALAHPELVRALVLVGPVVSGHPLSEHFLTRGGNYEAWSGSEIDYWAGADPWFVAPANTAARARLRALLAAAPQNAEPKPHERAADEPVAGRLGEVRVPTLIVTGADDIADVHAHSGVLEAGVPGARRVVLPDCGHSVPLEAPDALVAAIRTFLDGAAPHRA